MTTQTSVVDELGQTLAMVFKRLKAIRAHRVRTHAEVEYSSYPILFSLASGTPLRVSAIACAVHSDISTVSRQVNKLESQGVLTRSADPDDGRAAVIALTDKGHLLIEDEKRENAEWLGSLLSDWSEEDLRSLTDHLERFYDSLVASDSDTTHK